MTRDRKHKQEARARQAELGGTYFAARTATTQACAASRRRNATANLAARPETMIDALSRFCGLRPPSGPLGARLVGSVLDTLETAPPRPPLGPRWGEISRTLAGHETIDPVPDSIRAAARHIKELVTPLDDEQLVTAATELGLRESTIKVAAIYLVKRPRRATKRPKTNASDDYYRDAYPIAGENDWEDRREEAAVERARANAVRRLRNREEWRKGDNDVLRYALADHLGRIGDGYLTATEERLKLLTWHRQSDGALRADVPINGAPLPLSAVVSENVRHSDDPTSTPEFYQPDMRQSAIGYVCHVGVIHSATGDFDQFNLEGHLPSIEAAQLEGARMIARIAADPRRHRAMFSKRPLVPRTADTCDDPYALTLNLGMVLQRMGAEYNSSGDDPEGWLWSARPHATRDKQLTSVTALVLDGLGLPWPRPETPACDQPVGSATFQDYLATQGVHMTALARCYLAGTDDAGAGGQFLVDRHAAGIAAVLATHELSAVISELAEEYPAAMALANGISPDRIALQLRQLGAVSALLADLDRDQAELTGQSVGNWWDTYNELDVIDRLDTYPWVVWSLKMHDPQDILRGIDVDARTRTAAIATAAEFGCVFEDYGMSEDLDGSKDHRWRFGIKQSEHLRREPERLQPFVLADLWAELLLALPTEVGVGDPDLWSCGPSLTLTHIRNEFDGGYSANQIDRAYR